jgi:hypothetical protein
MSRDGDFVPPVGRHDPVGRRWRARRRDVATRLACIMVFAAFANSCSTGADALSRSSDEVQRLVAELEAAPVPRSYRYSYEPVSAMFLSCASGVEDIDVVVDAEQRAVRFAPRQRRGVIYSLDGYALIDAALLDSSQIAAPFGSLELGPDPAADTFTRLEAALGTTLATQLAGGAWPTHPTDIVTELVSAANAISLPDPDTRGLRFVLNPERFAREVGPAVEDPPIVDVSVNDDGSISRIVVRAADPANPTQTTPDSDGYALTYDYTAPTHLAVPGGAEIAPLSPDQLPPKSTAIPCVVEP